MVGHLGSHREDFGLGHVIHHLHQDLSRVGRRDMPRGILDLVCLKS